MRGFFGFSLLYVLFALAVLAAAHDAPLLQLHDAYLNARDGLAEMGRNLPSLAIGLAVAGVLIRQLGGQDKLREAAWAFAACVIFSAAFFLVKSALPHIVPFYADPFLASLDRLVHGGTDPWAWTHQLGAWVNPHWVNTLYFGIWGVPAAFFPVLLVLCDNDRDRQRRFLVLFCVAWIGLGNMLAYAGASVGPVYYDRLLGGERFAEFSASLAALGIVDTQLGRVQDGLWHVYLNHGQALGSSISAFPSTHNAIAALSMLYLFERGRWLAPIGVLFCAAILFSSVYIGWHYAMDGYVSILVMTGAWGIQRRFVGQRRRNVAFASYKPA